MASKVDGVVGDGAHDDTAGLQRLLDSGAKRVYLPPPAMAYLIRRPLRVHSGQSLLLDRATVVRLADGANVHMLENAAPDVGDRDITIEGGIWDCNNVKQVRAPWDCVPGTKFDVARYIGVGWRLRNVRNLHIRGVTIKDPESFAMQLGQLERFTIEDITFDFNLKTHNQDGVHVHGPARFGRIANIQGAGNDDHVALNADDGEACEMTRGPISDIQVDGIFAENGYTAVRMLSAGSKISRVRISNVFGTYRYHLVSFTHHNVHPGAATVFEDVLLDGLFASKPAEGSPQPLEHSDKWGLKDCAQIFIAPGARVDNVHIRDLHRTESRLKAADTIFVGEGARVGRMTISDCSLVNRTERAISMLVNRGRIASLVVRGVCAEAEGGEPRGAVLVNHGTIENCSLSDVWARNVEVRQEGA